jgi:thiamine biosynthesis lipoprotein
MMEEKILSFQMETDMKKQKKIITVLAAVLVILIGTVAFLWSKFGQRASLYSCTNYAMDCYIQQNVYGRNAKTAASNAAAAIGTLENLITLKSSDSDIAKLNAAAGTEWISINAKTAKLLRTVLAIAKDSNGAYDPTILPVSALWNFGGDNQRVPAKSVISKFLQYVNYKDLRVSFSDDTASLRNHYEGVTLDAVRAGAACDEAVAAYQSSGSECGVVSVGTSIGMYGQKADGSAWSIAVGNPTSNSSCISAFGELKLTSGFISTVGTGSCSFVLGGKTYHSLLNPKTGYSENNGLSSVTVISSSGVTSDALAYACFILGREKSISLLKKYNAEAIFSDSSNHVFITDGLKQNFTLTSSDYVIQS